MKYQEVMMELQQGIEQRYSLMKEKVKELLKSKEEYGIYSDYVNTTAAFLNHIYEAYEEDIITNRDNLSQSQFEQWNTLFYDDIKEPNYANSYANPDKACEAFGAEIGKYLCFLYTELRSLIPSAYSGNIYDITIFSELFVEAVTLMKEEFDETTLVRELHQMIYDFEKDYSEVIVNMRIRNQLDPDMDFATEIIMKSDLSSEKYLYFYGDYIGKNEIESMRYLNQLSQEEIDAMAFTYTDGYREGFEIAGISLENKNTVNIRYPIGFERVVRSAIKQFAELGLKPSIYPAAVKSLDKRRNLKVGYASTSPNKQYDYDHRFDNGLYLDKAFVERRLEVIANTYEELKDLCKGFAGPACIEVFGEADYEPENKLSAVVLTSQQQKFSVKLDMEASKLANQYIPRDEYSFTIIAYPVAEIGADYEDIFRETVKVNTLDKSQYRKIQQTLIDALDEAEYVRIKGANGNRTDMKVMLHTLQDAAKETNFENCLADVNIPVGEVFTSPQLTGTQGTLHVSSVFLNDLDYKNLELVFENGMVKEYHCTNFAEEEQNQKFIKENLLNHHDTLPLGEFAIGTNTTAYAMAKRYDIIRKLPILIVEKMGPHFAIGDTCYSHSEEVRLYNPDGKEIVAKENECSVLRKEDIDKAYFNCHTDITIPYNEIASIVAVRPDKSEIALLENGRFVLEGTQWLNEALMEE